MFASRNPSKACWDLIHVTVQPPRGNGVLCTKENGSEINITNKNFELNTVTENIAHHQITRTRSIAKKKCLNKEQLKSKPNNCG